MAQPPFFLIEFARTEQGDEPFGFRFDSQEYLVRSEGGAFKTARFAWTRSFGLSSTHSVSRGAIRRCCHALARSCAAR